MVGLTKAQKEIAKKNATKRAITAQTKKYTIQEFKKTTGIKASTYQQIDKFNNIDDVYVVDKKGSFEKIKKDDYTTLLGIKGKKIRYGKDKNPIVSKKNKEELNNLIFNSIKKQQKINNKIVFSTLDKTKRDLKIWVSCDIHYEVSDTEGGTIKTYLYTGKNDKDLLEDFAEKIVNNYIMGFNCAVKYSYTVSYADNNENELNFENMKLRERENISNLVNIFGNNIDLNISSKNCVKNALSKFNIKSSIIEELSDDFTTAEQLYQFCKKHNIKCIIYNKNGNVLFKNISTELKKKTIYMLCYNEHLYILKMPYLDAIVNNKFSNYEFMELTQTELNKKFLEIVGKNIIPADLKASGKVLKSFVDNNKLYYCNEQYERCYEILKSYGIEEKMNFNVTFDNIGKLIEPLFLAENVESFFPFDIKKRNYDYHINYDEIDHTRKIKNIDIKLCFTTILKNFSYLLSVDFRYAKINKKVVDIVEHNLYIATPEIESQMMQGCSVYWGKKLIKARECGLKFTISEEIVCEKKKNNFNNMVENLMKKTTHDEIKRIMNVHIGKFAGFGINPFCEMEITGYVPPKESNYHSDKIKIKFDIDDKEHALTYDVKQNNKINIYNRLPITIMIKDMCDMIVFDKIQELKLKDDDIIGIFTDNIIYYDNGVECDDPLWRNCDEIKQIQFGEMHLYDDKYTFTKPSYMTKNNNVFVHVIAGGGKSTHIKNELLKALNYKDYRVLSPTHASINDYRKNKYVCDVIQKYSLNNTVPTENNIIIDEIGMCGFSDLKMIITCMILKKNIYAYGDFRQLAPVKGGRPNKYFLKSIFDTIVENTANWRNDIPNSKYEEMLDIVLTKEYINNLIDEYCNDPNPNIYIAFEKETMIKKNLEILEKLGKFKDGDKKKTLNKKTLNKDDDKKKTLNYDRYMNGIYNDLEDCPIYCKCNDYGEYGLYNNFPSTILKFEDNMITVKGVEKDLTIKFKTFLLKFAFGYCINLHCIQGGENEKIQFVKDDINYLFDNSRLYTLISRYKVPSEKLSKKTIKYNMDHLIDYELPYNMFD